MSLNGWQRIGVVLSIIWFVGFAWYVWSSDRQHKTDFYVGRLSVCSDINDMANESLSYIQDQQKRDEREAANGAKYEQCKKDAEEFYEEEVGGNAGWGQWAFGMGILIAVDLLIIAIAWLLAWLTIRVVRWVGRGFNRA